VPYSVKCCAEGSLYQITRLLSNAGNTALSVAAAAARPTAAEHRNNCVWGLLSSRHVISAGPQVSSAQREIRG
jgi:hypothetical protein